MDKVEDGSGSGSGDGSGSGSGDGYGEATALATAKEHQTIGGVVGFHCIPTKAALSTRRRCRRWCFTADSP